MTLGAAPTRRITARHGVIDRGDGPQLVADPCWELDTSGQIVAIGDAANPLATNDACLLHDLGPTLVIPGMVNAHSHAFQRAIRGRTGRRGAGDPSSFWSWREAMYRVANELEVEQVYEVTKRCFDEMLRSGITCVGEFHYLHHRPGGGEYDNPHALSDAVIRAARDTGLRLVLLEVYYARAGAGRPAEPGQLRFCDASVDHYLARVQALCERGLAEGFAVGVAPHSVRAVPAADLEKIADFANRHDLVMHSHVSEQTRENEECQSEHACSPLELFERTACLERPSSFTAVHAIALEQGDLSRLQGQRVCACPTTEADLGDGIVPARALMDAEVDLCLGSDSNATIDLVQEARLVEMNERLSRQSRLCLADSGGHVAPNLLHFATRGGAQSLGQATLGSLAIGSPFDAAGFSLDHPFLADVAPEYLVDALMLSGSAAGCGQVWVAGERLV